MDKPHIMRSQITTWCCRLQPTYLLYAIILWFSYLPREHKSVPFASDCKTSLDTHPLCVLFLQSWRLMATLLPLKSVMWKLHCRFILVLYFTSFLYFLSSSHLIPFFRAIYFLLPSCANDQPPPNTKAFWPLGGQILLMEDTHLVPSLWGLHSDS